MNFSDLELLFNRSLSHALSPKKLLLVSSVLWLGGVLTVFCRALAFLASEWMLMSLAFLPIFLGAGMLLAMGVILIRVYHDEVKKRKVSYHRIVGKSWQVALGASYFFVPVILCYLLMWMVLGVFFLLREIPSLGEVFGVMLAFGPFLINLGSLLLCLGSLGLLFFVTPAFALKSQDPLNVSHVIVYRITSDVFSNLILLAVATLPLLGVAGLLSLAAVLTGTTYVAADDAISIVLQWFFIMIPFAALLSPAVVFFFNIAAESHVLMKKRQRQLG